MDGIDGPYIVWENYGYEGWKPKSYPNLKEALTTPRYVSEWEITKRVEIILHDDGKLEVGP